jgi:putative ABC transport system permease protein
MGVIVGSELADQYGWKVGDRIPLISPVHVRADNGPWEFNIRGIFEAKSKGMQPDFLVLHFDYMAEGRGGNYDVYWYELNVKDPLQIDKVAKRIDAEFRNTSRPTSTRTMAALSVQFSSQFGKFGMIASLILSAVLFTMLLVTGNTMMQAFRERIHEFAVLRSLGFSSMALLYLILAESIIMVIIGGLPGIGLVWIAQDFLQPWFTGLYVRPVVVLQALGLMLIMGLLVGLIPAVSAKRLTIVDALRRRQ